MASFPASLASNHITEAGAITPTHGGMVQGHEFDLPISTQNRDNLAPEPQAQTSTNEPSRSANNPQNGVTNTAAQAVPRRSTSTNASKPRPVSMPPQPSAGSDDRQRASDGASGSRRPDAPAGSRSRSSHRILGDYTLSKTLGAGSMGKVKLAHHNVTGEKVRLRPLSRFPNDTYSVSLFQSSLSRSYREYTQGAAPSKRAARKQQPSRPRKMPRRRFERCAKLRFRCSSTTRTSAACAR